MPPNRRSSTRLQTNGSSPSDAPTGSSAPSPASLRLSAKSESGSAVKRERITHHFAAADGGLIDSPLKRTAATRRGRNAVSDAGDKHDALALKDEDAAVDAVSEQPQAEEEPSSRPSVSSAPARRGGKKRGRAADKEEPELTGVADEVGDAAAASAAPSTKTEPIDVDADADGDDADEWDAATSDVQSQLTYEQQRQANIRRNAEQMRLLQIPSILPPTSTHLRRKRPPAEPRAKRVSMPQRRSLRNQGLDPEGNQAELKEGEGRYVPVISDWVRPTRRDGPIDMSEVIVQVHGSYDSKGQDEDEAEDDVIAVDDDGEEKSGDEKKGSAQPDPVVSSLCHAFTELTTGKGKGRSALPPPLTPARVNALQHIGMTNKLTKKRCTTMAFHPASTLSRTVLVSGDKAGQVGVVAYDDHRRLHHDGVLQCAFEPHAGGVNSFCFHARTHDLYSCSNDGSIRHFSFEAQTFADAFVNDGEDGLYTITSSAHHPSSLFTCDRKGDLIVLDASSPSSLTVSSRTSLSRLKVNCVDVHPGGHLLASCGNDRTVRLWDLRRMKDDQALHTFEHGYSVNSVYFSPSGELLLSTCIDDLLRVWGVTGEDVGAWSDCVRLRHNNHTGRWVTLFRARWTGTDDAFLVGNMTRQVDLYGWGAGGAWEAGRKTVKTPTSYALTSAELTAIPSVVATHPSNTYFMAATASAYAYVWSL